MYSNQINGLRPKSNWSCSLIWLTKSKFIRNITIKAELNEGSGEEWGRCFECCEMFDFSLFVLARVSSEKIKWTRCNWNGAGVQWGVQGINVIYFSHCSSSLSTAFCMTPVPVMTMFLFLTSPQTSFSDLHNINYILLKLTLSIALSTLSDSTAQPSLFLAAV